VEAHDTAVCHIPDVVYRELQPFPSTAVWDLRTVRFLTCLCGGGQITLAAALDATSISVALPIIAEKLRGSAIEAFWSGTSFLLCSTVFQPTYASFSNIFGRRPILIIALTFFTAGSLIGALADNFTVLLIGRSIQGVGGGGIISLCEIVITDIVRWLPLLRRDQRGRHC
jgi:MFS family permease